MESTMVTQDKLKERLSYDPKTGDFTWKISNSTRAAGEKAGYVKTKRLTGACYVSISIRGSKYSAHRLAFLYQTGEFPEFKMKHKNGDNTDNRWINLAVTTTKLARY